MTETGDNRTRGPDRTPDDALETAFAAARAEAARSAPDALLARIEKDALASLPRPASPVRGGAVQGGGLAAAIGRLLAPVGGWPALGGFVTATAAGVWLGLAPPAAIEAQGGWLAGVAVSGEAESDLALLQPDDYFAEAEEG